jgi:hypothetical protein
MSGDTYSSGAQLTWCGSSSLGATRQGTLLDSRSPSCATGSAKRKGRRPDDVHPTPSVTTIGRRTAARIVLLTGLG